MKPASPLSRSASASQLNWLPFNRKFDGAGGAVVSVTEVSLTYCIHDRAMVSFGSHAAFSGSPAKAETGTASVPVTGASHAWSVGMSFSGSVETSGKRAVRQASSQGIAKYR